MEDGFNARDPAVGSINTDDATGNNTSKALGSREPTAGSTLSDASLVPSSHHHPASTALDISPSRQQTHNSGPSSSHKETRSIQEGHATDSSILGTEPRKHKHDDQLTKHWPRDTHTTSAAGTQPGRGGIIAAPAESGTAGDKSDAPSKSKLSKSQFVSPLSYLRPASAPRSTMAAPASHLQAQAQRQGFIPKLDTPFDKDQKKGLVCGNLGRELQSFFFGNDLNLCTNSWGQTAIRDFLKVRTSYDAFPLSFRLIVLDTELLIKKSLNILTQNCMKPSDPFISAITT